MAYRTRTYLAAGWTEDENAVCELRKWNDSEHWGLSFSDAHDLQESRDGSLPCTIKRSLGQRLDVSKRFVLIVGENTKELRNGSCQYCASYNSRTSSCARGHHVDYRSYIEYECERAVRDEISIVVLYKYDKIVKSKCPDILVNKGIHSRMRYRENGKLYWDYQPVKDAFDKS